MTRAELVAAAIERLNLMESDWRETRLWEVAVELARLLRESNPPTNSESSGESIPGLRDGVTPEICLSNGTYLNFNHPTFAEFGIEEIAQALSKLCRFVGQSRRFYSVAQHSVIVSKIVPAEFALHGLLHDAAEAFVGDVTKPLKSILPGYKDIERRVASAAFARFGITEPMPPCVAHADLVALKTERRDLMPEGNEDWAGFADLEPLHDEIVPLWPEAAYRLFMDRYNEIVSGINIEPAAPAVGEDEALLAAAERFADDDERGCVLMGKVAARLRAALADVARLESSPSRYEDLMAIEQLQTQVDHYRKGMIAARAALAAAEQEKEKAVAESAKVRRIASYVDPMVWIAAKEKAGHATTIRARAGRNDG